MSGYPAEPAALAATIADERYRALESGAVRHEQIEDGIFAAEELTAAGWVRDPDTWVWRPVS